MFIKNFCYKIIHYLKYIMSRCNKKIKFIFFNPRMPTELPTLSSIVLIENGGNTTESEVNKDIELAEGIINNRIRIFYSKDVEFKDRIRWNVDSNNGFKWPNKFFTGIRIINKSNNADIKIPWELSRFNYLQYLGRAFKFSSNVKYAEKFKSLIREWIEENPVYYSVNWTCSMEVAIRACNWIYSIGYFKEYLINDTLFLKLFNKSLFSHGIYIFHNLENNEYKNNHYISDLVGLIWIGIYFIKTNYPDLTKQGNLWLEFALKEIDTEIDTQFFNDGVNFELSTSYHCFIGEMLSCTEALCLNNNVQLPKRIHDNLSKINLFSHVIRKPNNQIPYFGDNDSGRFLLYPNSKVNINSVINNVKTDSDLENLQESKESNKHGIVKYFPDSGFYIYKNEKIYFIIKCSNKINSGHAHNDQLSFELNYYGVDFIIDCGTYTYSADFEKRNQFRSTQSHNTLQIDNQEQNTFFKDQIFNLSTEAIGSISKANNVGFTGCHLGYLGKNNAIHKRSVTFKQNQILIEDKLFNCHGNVIIVKEGIFIRFHLDPGIEISNDGKSFHLLSTERKIQIKFEYSGFLEAVIKKCLISKEYDKYEDSQMIELKSEEIGTYRSIFTLL